MLDACSIIGLGRSAAAARVWTGELRWSCGMMVVSRQSSRHKMWTEITRRKYEREGRLYASDVTNAEWALIEPHT